MARIKIGGIYILDENCLSNLKEYEPVKVRVIKKMKWNKYLCSIVEPVIYPCLNDGYATKNIVVGKEFLTPSSLEEKVVIRFPVNTPKFSQKDIRVLNYIINIIPKCKENESIVKQINNIIEKINYYESLKGE